MISWEFKSPYDSLSRKVSTWAETTMTTNERMHTSDPLNRYVTLYLNNLRTFYRESASGFEPIELNIRNIQR